MYTSAPFQKKPRAKAQTSTTATGASSSAKHLCPLPLLSRTDGTCTPSPPVPPSTSLNGSPRATRSLSILPILPHRASAFPSPDEGERTRHVVMDPLAALRRCLQYVCSHPEIYGTDVRGLLDREVMHVMRLKTSELSLTNGQRPLFVNPLESVTVRHAARSLIGAQAYPTIPTQSTASSGGVPGSAAAGDLFGYGNVSFLPVSSVGFSALLQDFRGDRARADLTGDCRQADGRETLFGGAPSTSWPAAVPAPPLEESIQWSGTLPPSLTSTRVRGTRSVVHDDEAVKGSGFSENVGANGGGVHPGETHGTSQFLSRMSASAVQDKLNPQLQRLVLDPSEDTASGFSAALPNASCAAEGMGMMVDQQGYEATYLRAQLQQLEAAFNGKCVRLYELEVENRQCTEKMKASEEARARWATQHHTMRGQLEVMRRELDGWKDRASDAVSAATKQSKQRSQQAKRIVHNQLSDAKQEIVRLGQLWRETERALQETRRVFENTEKEALAAHNHLTDVFHYLERLERRIARRDAYVLLCERRQRSLEEKYEKLRWGYEELSTLEGRYSYVDYMLTTRPLWSVYLFVRLARHLGDYVALENPAELQQRLLRMMGQEVKGGEVLPAAAAATLAAMEPLYGLIFSRSPQGGRLVAKHYDFHLVFCTIVDEVTAEVSCRGRPKQLLTNLHGPVACRVIRWHERYSIDYLRGREGVSDSAELHRKFVPLLTVATLLLPLRSRTGTLLVRPQPAEATDHSTEEANSKAVDEAASAEEARVHTLLSTTPNKRHYDEATVRFVLRCFWKERLAAFSQQMSVRVGIVNARREDEREPQSTQRTRSAARNLSPSGARRPVVGDESNYANESDDEEENVVVIQSFLAALVDFSARFTAPQPCSVMGAPTKSRVSPSKATLLSVRGVLTSGASAGKLGGRCATNASSPELNTASDSVWDCGRIFFAVVLQPQRAPTTEEGAASPMRDVPTQEEVNILAEEARELLAALYYYTLEYKDLDPDFRLFYLVAHQLIPEMVAVNFFAGIEAFQLDSVGLLERRLQCFPSSIHGTASRTAAEQLASSPIMPKEVEDPLTALTRAVDVMDEALLDGEEEDIEPDSDGDGYGSILPFHPKAEIHLHPTTTYTVPEKEPQEEKGGDTSTDDAQAPAPPASQRARELQLLHNIRAYLRERETLIASKDVEDRGIPCVEGGGGSAELNGVAENPTGASLATVSFDEVSSEWTALEEQIMTSLGPHTALLDTFRRHYRKQRTEDAAQAKGEAVRLKKELDHVRKRRADRKRRYETTKHLSATRGLLSVDDILALVQRHCLATYAVSCCGTPRFSLLHSVFGRSNDTSLDPYAIVGHLPLTGLQLQRLRFALSLDQPSHLIRPSALFTIDPVTKSSSQFYDAYLTVVLDVFEQQQSFLMHSVLHSCATRHECYAAEGAEDCDGFIPIAWLKKGLTAAFSTIRGTSKHVQAVLSHFMQYDELLRLEDEVKFEQFTDAPLLLNVPPSDERGFSKADRDVSVRRCTVADSLADAVGQGSWNLHEEADSCSLLHIAFAVRMSYIVWGEVSAGTSEALVNRIVKREVPVCCCDPTPGDADPAALVNKDSTVVVELSEWDIFDQMTRQQYTQALSRLQKGHNSDANPLRRMLSVLQRGLLRPPLIRRPQGTGDASISSFPGTVDVNALYPDVASMWTTKKALTEGQKRMEVAAATLATRSVSTSGKGKRKTRALQLLKSLSEDQANATDDGSLDEELQVPDHGLLSLVRALGFALPSSTGVSGVPGAVINSKKGGGKKGAKKSGAGPETAVSALLQQEYNVSLSAQLQDLAARVAALASSDSKSLFKNMSDAADISVNIDGCTQSPDSLSASNQCTAAPTPGSALPRLHSADASGSSLQRNAQSKLHKDATEETLADTAVDSLTEPDAMAPRWVPVFPHSSSMFDSVSAPVPIGTPMDVSRLYAVCAALSMV
ncbi:hypothetical protein Q4I32_003152 [Leishmania shawi]|uniref:Uncharacterized protein n=1 Tax=Leishmania shawi TaxID=5680 RepID=A0AAW3BZ86_9TRYP